VQSGRVYCDVRASGAGNGSGGSIGIADNDGCVLGRHFGDGIDGRKHPESLVEDTVGNKYQ
jgi:hypothetical protein